MRLMTLTTLRVAPQQHATISALQTAALAMVPALCHGVVVLTGRRHTEPANSMSGHTSRTYSRTTSASAAAMTAGARLRLVPNSHLSVPGRLGQYGRQFVFATHTSSGPRSLMMRRGSSAPSPSATNRNVDRTDGR
jgi:hypothetical protein